MRERLPLLLLVGLVTAAHCVPLACAEAPARSGDAEAKPEIPLTGRQIYEKFLDNQVRASFQRMRVVSRDPGGSGQVTSFEVWLQDYRDAQKQPVDGVKSKMLLEVTAPKDMRHAAYLIVAKDPDSDDGYAYQPSLHRVRRMDLRNTSLFGTDFTFYTFNEIAFLGVDDSEYERLPDEEIGGVPVYVVEARVRDSVDVEYRRTITYLEKEHHVALRMRYWNENGVEVKEMTAPHAKIRAFGDTWVATESTMTDLRQGTSSTIYIDQLDTDPSFDDRVFSLSNLSRGH